MKHLTLAGLTPDELLALTDDEINTLILCGKPLAFRAGSAEILGKFWVENGSLVMELAHIDGGGEGVLPMIAVLAERYASRQGLCALDWRVHALKCARPNPKLRRVLERRDFSVSDVPGTGMCYHRVQGLAPRADTEQTK